jgi:hypothetical protein
MSSLRPGSAACGLFPCSEKGRREVRQGRRATIQYPQLAKEESGATSEFHRLKKRSCNVFYKPEEIKL